MGFLEDIFGEEFYVKGLEQISPNIVIIYSTKNIMEYTFRVPPECVMDLEISAGDRIKIKSGGNAFHGAIEWVKKGNKKYKINRS